MDEKKNHSNDPSSTQPIDEQGRYAEKPSLESQVKEDGTVEDIRVLSATGMDDDSDLLDYADDDDLLEFGEGLDDEWDTPKPSGMGERFTIGDELPDFMPLSQEEASKQADELAKEIQSMPNGWVDITASFSAGRFDDQRSRLACLYALKKVVGDFPQLLGMLNNNKVTIGTGVAKSIYFSKWGDAGYYTHAEYDFSENKYKYSINPQMQVRMFKSSHGYAAPCTKSVEDFLKEYKKSNFHDQFSSDSEVLTMTMFHELGHIIHYNLMRNDSPSFYASGTGEAKLKMGLIGKKFQQAIMNKATELFPEITHLDALTDTSGYGKTNMYEWFAETFASMYSKTPRKVAIAMREVLKEVFK